MRLTTIFLFTLLFLGYNTTSGQSYFYAKYQPFAANIPSPEEFLGYPIGSQHTRHDRIVAYFDKLAELSERATISRYGKTHEQRELVMLTISSTDNMTNLEAIKKQHLGFVDSETPAASSDNLPVFINLAYNVHGNEPSSAEAAMLTAYTLVASNSSEIERYLQNAVLFIDPAINPDGRERHTQWANQYKATPLVEDPLDAEHNEAWPRGRTNHYWFDLNRDWWLAINPESRGKVNWYHQWYPNVVTDFHEMGTNSTYFFEPMKPNGSKNPIMPKENYTTLNDLFATYFARHLDEIGSLYYTKESFDGTYPGYGSSYPDLQGGLALLFEQASSRGLVQQTPTGKITFAFTIRNQFTSSLATVEAAVDNKKLLYDYQKSFFKSALSNAAKSKISAYVFGDNYDYGRTQAFIDKLLLHRVKVYALESALTKDGYTYQPGKAFVVPTNQPQYRMIQSAFETYKEYADSVYYDASSWSLANFYNMKYAAISGNISKGAEITTASTMMEQGKLEKGNLGYIISWDDYSAPQLAYYLQSHGAILSTAFKPFSITAGNQLQSFDYGTVLVHNNRQTIAADSIYNLLAEGSAKFEVTVLPVNSSLSSSGIDLGSNFVRALEMPSVLMLIGEGVSSYEAGEIWHLLDTRVTMPVTKLQLTMFNRADLDKYNVLVMVSGSYNDLDSVKIGKIKDWVKKGNTLITIRGGTEWAINKKVVNEELLKEEKGDKKEVKKAAPDRLPYVNAPENAGKEQVGGAIFKVDLDLTHPLAFGYHDKTIPVYRNSNIWLAPSKNPYSTVAKYAKNPHIDGFITEKNLANFLTPSASLIVSPLGSGRVVLFADNPNFRGSWYGTNRLFLNAIFLGQHIRVP